MTRISYSFSVCTAETVRPASKPSVTKRIGNKKFYFCGSTFEPSGRQRQNAKTELAKMYLLPPDRVWWPVVGVPFERGLGGTLCSFIAPIFDKESLELAFYKLMRLPAQK
jgi:hypothetical protein